MKPGGYEMYGELLAHRIRDVRKVLSASPTRDMGIKPLKLFILVGQ
jgi:hypothetical protein